MSNHITITTKETFINSCQIPSKMIKPSEIEHAKANYSPLLNSDYRDQTDIQRITSMCGLFNSLKRKKINIATPVNVLLVGIGYKSRTLIQGTNLNMTCQPQMFASYLERENIDYSITVLDINKEALEDVLNRKHIFVASSYFKSKADEYSPCMNKRKEFWNHYLKITNQSDLVTHKSMNGLNIEPLSAAESILESGVHYARIPKKFQDKLDRGEIKIIESDIALTTLEDDYDYIGCINTLYMLDQVGQQLAMYNMMNALSKTGFLHILNPETCKHHGKIRDTQILKINNGWLDSKACEYLDIKSGSYNRNLIGGEEFVVSKGNKANNIL